MSVPDKVLDDQRSATESFFSANSTSYAHPRAAFQSKRTNLSDQHDFSQLHKAFIVGEQNFPVTSIDTDHCGFVHSSSRHQAPQNLNQQKNDQHFAAVSLTPSQRLHDSV
ncbi:hypothetical protein PoB_004103900 [Plakobranchus ocellatus]|uniref:Uncharacterized protein n=1 Tax=Plakobranchus ocellatus TaxID=259542 RepID=A0AAV4B851_9GAST|nr:hypothetical protein PoB_004103900 [Plakobranchus ocellatus]